MGANLNGQTRRDKSRLLQDIKDLDGKADSQRLNNAGWWMGYNLERELEEIYSYKERI
jgi:hypothetical protein